MNRFVSNRKCMVFCLLSFALGAAAAFGDNGDKDSKREDKVAAYYRSVAATKNRLALEAYENRNAEIAPWPKNSVPANTDNAALLYYQACLFVPEPNEALRYEIRPNAGPTPQIKTYLGKCLPVIEMVETASRIPECNWAVWPELRPGRARWRQNILFLTDILLLDATTLAVDGHYRVALERCLTSRRIARHLSDDPELYFFETGPDVQALHTIEILLGMMPPNADILTWFSDQLTKVPGPRLSFATKLQGMLRIQIEGMNTYPDHLRHFRELAVKEAEGEKVKDNIRNLTDEQFRSRVRQGLEQFNDTILQIINSEDTFKKKLSQVHELFNKVMEEDDTDPIVKGFISPSGINMEQQIAISYSRNYAKHKARINRTKAATEIYLVLAKTGKLPQKIPGHLPKDPFTGKDFGYKITDEGFALRYQGEDFFTQKNQFFEFRVRR